MTLATDIEQPPSGLSETEAADRLKAEGLNELPQSKAPGIFTIAFRAIREPMFLLLIASGAIYLALGERREATLLLGFVVVVISITVYQERKTERSLEALRDLSSPRALVVRGGKRLRIPGREVVRGDILVLAEGDRVPADAVVLSSINLLADESLLTGESVPARKVAWDGKAEMGRPGGDDLPFVYSGTLVVRGQGVAEVKATGTGTEMGKIGKALQTVEPEKTSLQRETGKLVRQLSILGVSLSLLVVIAFGITRGNWLNGFLAGVALAMAMLPEEFPVVLTIFLAMGAWRISKKNVLTRRMTAIEALGETTVLCVDKTGTLTLNRMTVARIANKGDTFQAADGKGQPLPEDFHELVEFSVLASQRDPFDPMEKAINEFGEGKLARTEHLHQDWRLIREYPLSPQLLALSHVWQSPDGGEYVIAAKGSPEAIVDLCHLNQRQQEEISRHAAAMAEEGMRVLGVARAGFARADLPKEQHDFAFHFLGLVGLVDPIRPTVPGAIRDCYSAGIRVVMITGDHPRTAQHIAREIGLKDSERVLTGPEVDKLDDAALQERAKHVTVFARVVPEQKFRLVKVLKAQNEVVTMTGDGVNDAPALKAAHIGVAMGARGTDVARESSSLVLLDDDFSSIVQAVKQGRRIFDNLRKATAFIISVHVPIAGISFIPVLLGWPLVLFPVHIAFLELIIDPACSIVFEAEPEEKDVMKRPPRSQKEALFSRSHLGYSLLQGVSVLAVVVVVFAIALHLGQDEAHARALTFTTLIIGNLGLILTNRSWSRSIVSLLRTPNAALWWVLGGTVVFLALVLYVPVLRDMFHLASLGAGDWIVSIGAGLVSVAWFEALKLVWSIRRRRSVEIGK